ncbi:1-acyl-sn-glycerol-3-phosphate acyltransferase [bacterium]|nr:1-acyl-sn-glycerol-3-phosphate acyltransferase [bacterium]
MRSYIQKPQQYDPWLKRRIITLFKILRSEPHVEFSEPLPLDQPLIFMANHTSLIDIPLLKASIPAYFIGILAHLQFSYFMYGPAARRIGSIPIDRENIRLSLKSFDKARELLQQGIHITVLPEGSRSKDGHLMPFKKLPFRFAKESNAAIVPMAISGVFKMKNKDSLHLTPGKIIIRFGSPIGVAKIASMETEDLMEVTRKEIYSLLEPFEAGES